MCVSFWELIWRVEVYVALGVIFDSVVIKT